MLTLMNFSDSPRHFEITELAATLKNVTVPNVSELSALASIVLPMPGGPCNSTPLHGRTTPLKSSGYSQGCTTLSCKIDLASSLPCTSDHLMLQSRLTMSLRRRNEIYTISSLQWIPTQTVQSPPPILSVPVINFQEILPLIEIFFPRPPALNREHLPLETIVQFQCWTHLSYPQVELAHHSDHFQR